MVSRSEKRLSAKAVTAFRDPGRYADGGGLYLIVGENQRKRWVLRIQVDGRRRDFGLGSLGKVSLADAREKATELRTQYVNGSTLRLSVKSPRKSECQIRHLRRRLVQFRCRDTTRRFHLLKSPASDLCVRLVGDLFAFRFVILGKLPREPQPAPGTLKDCRLAFCRPHFKNSGEVLTCHDSNEAQCHHARQVWLMVHSGAPLFGGSA